MDETTRGVFPMGDLCIAQLTRIDLRATWYNKTVQHLDSASIRFDRTNGVLHFIQSHVRASAYPHVSCFRHDGIPYARVHASKWRSSFFGNPSLFFFCFFNETNPWCFVHLALIRCVLHYSLFAIIRTFRTHVKKKNRRIAEPRANDSFPINLH